MCNLKLIEASNIHREVIWYWRNDIATRKASFNYQIIDWEEHVIWFEKVLRDASSKFFIGEIENIPVGLIRFKKLKENNLIYEVSINISPLYRGKGIGKSILKNGINKLKDCDKNFKFIIAYIKAENFASISLFKGLGFVLKKKELNKSTYEFFVS